MGITVRFNHPRDGSILTAEIGSLTTGEQCIEGLMKAGFLDPAFLSKGYYALEVRQKTIQLSLPVIEAWIGEGEEITVLAYGCD